MMKRPAHLEAAHLAKTYQGTIVALRDLSLSVQPGEIVGLIGPNGSGKTTTIHMLVGLLRPDRGHITVRGHDLFADPLAAKRYLGFAPDEVAPVQELTGWEFVMFVAAMYGPVTDGVRHRARRLFELFGLEAAVHRLTRTYSRGMKRKTLLIASLAHDPDVLIWDEPFNGLDVDSIALVQTVLRAVRRQEKAVLLSTHYLALAQEICDRVYVLNRGNLLAEGPPPALMEAHRVTSLQHLYAKLVGIKDREDEMVAALQGQPPAGAP